jgi:hypothetical protein
VLREARKARFPGQTVGNGKTLLYFVGTGKTMLNFGRLNRPNAVVFVEAMLYRMGNIAELDIVVESTIKLR